MLYRYPPTHPRAPFMKNFRCLSPAALPMVLGSKKGNQRVQGFTVVRGLTRLFAGTSSRPDAPSMERSVVPPKLDKASFLSDLRSSLASDSTSQEARGGVNTYWTMHKRCQDSQFGISCAPSTSQIDVDIDATVSNVMWNCVILSFMWIRLYTYFAFCMSKTIQKHSRMYALLIKPKS